MIIMFAIVAASFLLGLLVAHWVNWCLSYFDGSLAGLFVALSPVCIVPLAMALVADIADRDA